MPSAAMEIILLERVENLGDMGELVRVRPGYARNYLLPQRKALRATKENIAYYEAQKAVLEKQNAERRKEAEKQAKKLEGLKVTLIRLGSDSGQLFGSVNARDIAEAINEKEKAGVARSQVQLNQSIKTIGLFPIPVALHPEVKVLVTVNVARSEDEAKLQAETGRAAIATLEAGEAAAGGEEIEDEATEKAKKELLDESALEAEKARKEAEAEEAEEEAVAELAEATEE